MFTTRIQRWGNSHAVRIPKQILEALLLEAGSQIEITSCCGEITLVPIRPEPNLGDLLSQITPENIHEEVDTNGVVGVEAW